MTTNQKTIKPQNHRQLHMEYNPIATIGPEWTPIDKPTQLNDVCTLISSDKEFFCGYTVPYEQFEYLYFIDLDSNQFLFAVQIKHNNQNYIRTLNTKPEKIFALRLYKKARQNES